MLIHLSNYNRPFRAQTHHISCVAHVINIAVQQIIGRGLQAEAPDNDDDYALGDEVDQLGDISRDVGTCLNRLRSGIIKIRYGLGKIYFCKSFIEFKNRSSPMRLSLYKHCCRISLCDEVTLLRDVRTRWNSTQEMISRAIRVKKAYNSFCLSESCMAGFSLVEDDWTFLEQLDSLLVVFKEITTALSASTQYPTISRTIISYNEMIDHIEDFSDNPRNHRLLRNAASLGREVLVKYYGRTDATHIYAVATAMDPRARFRWWTANGWEPDWVNTCQQRVRETWEMYYRRDTSNTSDCNPDLLREYARYGIEASSLLEDDQLHQYTTVGVTRPSSVPDLELSFWRGQVVTWPELSLMARHYLAIPATSTPAERCFSAARLLLPYTRNRLDPEKVKLLMLTNSWIDLGLE